MCSVRTSLAMPERVGGPGPPEWRGWKEFAFPGGETYGRLRGRLANTLEEVPLPLKRTALALLLVLLPALSANAQRHPGDDKRLPCVAQPNQKTVDLDSRRDYRGCRYGGNLAQPELSARRFLQHYEAVLGITDMADLKTVSVKRGLHSAHTRFVQEVRGIPVFGGDLSVHQGRNGGITAVHSHLRVRPKTGPIRAPIVRRGAVQLAEEAVGLQEERLAPRHRRVWFPEAGSRLRIAHEVWIYAAEPLGDFLVVVDGHSGKILFQENRMVFATGEALVYWPNPVQSSGNTSLQDNGGATNATLDGERVSVTLQGLDEGTGRLKGEYVDLTLSGGKTWTFANESDRIYEYDRADDRFEEAVIYHVVDRIQRYIHSLGFDDDVGTPNGIRDFPSMANAHWDDADNSFYSTADDGIHFGDGGVDDAEDGDIVAHEYGHAIQFNQNSCWGGAEMGAMGEGFGDYLAASFFHDAGDASYQSNHAACVGDWDAVSYSGSTPACLRRVDGEKIYPDDLVGQVHPDGEIWSAFLWAVRAIAGGTTTDQIVLEHHFALPCNATMVDAANGMLQADQDLNGGANAATIRAAACDRGIFSGTQCGGLSLELALTPSPAVSGAEATYTLTVRNASAAIVTNVSLLAEIPEGTALVPDSPSDLGREEDGSVVWPAVDVPAGGTRTLTFRVLVIAPGGGGNVFADDMEVGGGRWSVSNGAGSANWALSTENPFGGAGRASKTPTSEVGATACAGGKAGIFSCNKVDLEYWYPMSSIGGGAGTDGWGWTDPQTNKEYVLMGRSSGTAFIDVSTPSAPQYLGDLPTQTSNSDWRDIKVYENHAFIVSEASGHGMQVFDLTQLRSVASPPATFTATAHMSAFGNAHNIAINEDTGFAYVVGANTCSGGLYMVDISDPTDPTWAGCFADDGYTHDAQCVVYSGPDTEWVGKEICFAYNEDSLTIVDVSNKADPQQISRTTMEGSSYTHQGWLAQNQRYVLLNDEYDEKEFGHNTKTFVLDVSDLDAPSLVGSHLSALPAIDHNLYTEGDFVYEANYTAGLRILKMNDLATADLCEVASFDTYPDTDAAVFAGAWNVYAYFKSGLAAVMAIEGLALLDPDLTNPGCTGTGEGSGQSWFAANVDSISDQYLEIAGDLLVPAGAELRFWSDYDFEPGYDGGVVEIATTGGSWEDLGSKFTANGYSGEISDGYQNPIGGRDAFTGSSGGYKLSTVDLSDWSGQVVRLRFRAATDSSIGAVGWHVDDVLVTGGGSLVANASATAPGSGTISATLVTSIVGDGEEVVCGDGVIGPGEFCDDEGDSETCDADCTPARCGDNRLNTVAGETCDTGGTTATCDGDCTESECGDGYLNTAAGESCDDGNVTSFDGCSASCQVEEPLSLDARRCIQQNAIWASKAATVLFKEQQACTKDGSRDRLGGVPLLSCAAADRRGKVRKLEIKAEAVQAARCTEVPRFGFATAATIFNAATAETVAGLATVFGDDAGASLVDATIRANRLASTCQLTVQKFADKVMLMMVKEFAGCVKSEAADRDDPIATISRLSGCLDTLNADARGRIANATSKLAVQVEKKCLLPGVNIELLGGDCAAGSDADAIAACMETTLHCRTCSLMQGVFAMDLDCDAQDDGNVNGSCTELDVR